MPPRVMCYIVNSFKVILKSLADVILKVKVDDTKVKQLKGRVDNTLGDKW